MYFDNQMVLQTGYVPNDRVNLYSWINLVSFANSTTWIYIWFLIPFNKL